jgi:hypothetical protein
VTSHSDQGDGLRRTTDGLAFVRQHPEMFRQLAHDGPSAAALLTEVALRKSAVRLEVGRRDGWYVIHADEDWLADVSDRDPFTQLVPFPDLGPNAVHPEVVVVAFSAAFVTVTNDGVRTLAGEAPELAKLTSGFSSRGRSIVFKW